MTCKTPLWQEISLYFIIFKSSHEYKKGIEIRLKIHFINLLIFNFLFFYKYKKNVKILINNSFYKLTDS
jgi:hypothetical protein